MELFGLFEFRFIIVTSFQHFISIQVPLKCYEDYFLPAPLFQAMGFGLPSPLGFIFYQLPANLSTSELKLTSCYNQYICERKLILSVQSLWVAWN